MFYNTGSQLSFFLFFSFFLFSFLLLLLLFDIISYLHADVGPYSPTLESEDELTASRIGHRKHSQLNVGQTSARRGGEPMGFSERIDTILN